mgnify:FL=1
MCLTLQPFNSLNTQTHTPQMDREAVVFLIDASPAMLQRAPGGTTNALGDTSAGGTDGGSSSKQSQQQKIQTYLDVAIECARSMLRDRIVSAPSDKQGVVFFNTKNSRGLDEQVGGLSGRDNVFVLQVRVARFPNPAVHVSAAPL